MKKSTSLYFHVGVFPLRFCYDPSREPHSSPADERTQPVECGRLWFGFFPIDNQARFRYYWEIPG